MSRERSGTWPVGMAKILSGEAVSIPLSRRHPPLGILPPRRNLRPDDGGFAGLALIVAGLGLFGLVAFGAERRTREIGIRKILGATKTQILALMSKDVVPVVVVSNLVAWPLILTSWEAGWENSLSDRITWWLVDMTVSVTAAIALATIGYHALHAAGKNPAACLRAE